MPGGPRTPQERRRLRLKQEAERSRGLQVTTCKVCQDQIPEPFAHDHHEIPQAAGGAGSPIAQLCGGCHDNLHRVAEMVMSPKRAGLVEDSLAIMYPNTDARDRLMALAQAVVEYMTMKADGKIDLNHPVRVMIELEPEIKLAAQMMANEMRGPTGRKLGLARWISSMVRREVFKRYPHLKPKSP